MIDDEFDAWEDAEMCAWVRFLEPLLLTPPQFMALFRARVRSNDRARKVAVSMLADFL